MGYVIGEDNVSSGGSATTDASDLTSGTLSDDRLSSTVTKESNTFNGADQLVKLNGSGELPALDGSNLINLPSSGGTWTVKKATIDSLAGNTTDATATQLTLSLDANSTYIIKGFCIVDNNNDAYGVVSKVKFSNAVSGYFIPNEAEGVGSNVVSQQSYSASLTSKTLIEAPTTTTAVAKGSYSAGYTLVIATGGSGSSMTFTVALGFTGIGKYAYLRKESFYEYYKVS